MILRARSVLTMDGPPIEDGAVVVDGEFITAVGKFTDLRREHPADVVDLGERILLPGLINAHCHLDYTCLRGKIPRQKSFTDWVRAINAAKGGLSREDYIASINQGFLEAHRFGTTSMINLTAFPELIPFVKPTLRTSWMAELIDIRSPDQGTKSVETAMGLLAKLPEWGLAPHAPYTASPGLYHECQRRSVMLTTHLAESLEETSMFRDNSGPLYEFIRSINPAFDGGGRTPLAYFLDELDRGQPWLIAHLNELTDDDFSLLKKAHPKFKIVHCPRSHDFFGHGPFQYDHLKEHFPVALGTDSLASNEDLNLFAEMRRFRGAHPNIKPEEVVGMVTSALRLPTVGRLRAGYHADIIAITTSDSRTDLFEMLVAFAGEPWSMIGGKIGTI